MFTKHPTMSKVLNIFRSQTYISNYGRRLHKNHQQKQFYFVTKPPLFKSIQKLFNPHVRYQSSRTGIKKNLVIFLCAAAAGGTAAVYYLSLPNSTTQIDPEETTYVHENLEEDLTLLKEFGAIPYLIVGAGTAAHSAFRAIRTTDPTAKILVIGEESLLPYLRPPLSKEMWYDSNSDVANTLTFSQYNGKKRSLFLEVSEFYFNIKDLLESKNGGVSVIRGKKVIKVDPVLQTVYLDKNEEIKYGKCLIATGSKPKNLPVFENANDKVKRNITLFRTASDFQKLDRILRDIKSVVIVGGGYLGSELACGLAKRGQLQNLKVTQVFPEHGNLGKFLPEYLCKWTSNKIGAEGVNIISNTTVKSIADDKNRLILTLNDNQVLETDHIIVAVGGEPNTDLAAASGLEVDVKHGGFLVNAEMEARKNLWIAGDSSCFYDMKLGRRRVEHHDHAVVSGRLAGENMVGDPKPYTHQSMFWCDLGPEVGFEGIGNVDACLPTVGIFTKDLAPGDSASNLTLPKNEVGEKSEKDDYGKGIVFYLQDNIVVGIVLWNVYSKISTARKIINESKKSDDLVEIAKLFKLYSPDI